MNSRRGRTLAILSLAATAGLPVLILLMRMRFFTFGDDFSGFTAVGFALTWALALLLTGTVLGLLAWRDAPRSWLARAAAGVNAALLAALLWQLAKLG
jgi:hypothetical protein